ncbi:MAG: alpha/beta hydrolase [Nannocystaceae bacterium]
MSVQDELAAWRRRGAHEVHEGRRIFVVDLEAEDATAAASPPLLLLHGFPTASFDYARLLPHLGDRRRILLDFLGFGDSDKPRDHRYSLFEQAALAEAVIERRGVAEVDVVAHDMGSSIALILLERARLPVRRVVLMNGSLLLEHYRPLLIQRLLLHRVTGPLLSRLGVIREPVFARSFSRLFPSPPPADELAAFWSLIAAGGGDRIYHKLIQYLAERMRHEHAWMAALVRSDAPLLLLWGLLDPVARPAIAESIARDRPDARYVPLPELGHYPQWEDPPRIAAEIRGFLDPP